MALVASPSYREKFVDENFILKQDAIASRPWQTLDPTQVGPRFSSIGKTKWLDGKHVVFGKVTEGMNIVENMEGLGPGTARPA
jgi:cyclophilin family peptidyl-prolyl cis-trans isomerase